jgi:UDP-glucose:(heptosyl)LPS alpha-1,3-glucosyltransferase
MDLALVFPGCHRRGGVERSVWELSKHWAGRHSVTVYASDVDRQGLPDSVRVVPVEPARTPGPLAPWAFAAASRAVVQHARHDHVVSFGAEAAPGLADVLWVNSVHRSWLQRQASPGGGLRESPLRRLLPHHQVLLGLERRHFHAARSPAVSSVVVVADAVGADLVRLYGVPPTRLTTFHNGFDPAEFRPRPPAERAAVRAELGLSDDALVLLMVANELGRKGFRTLLEAAGRVRDADAHVLLAGSADPAAYARTIAEAGMTGRVSWVGSRSDIGSLHAASDLFVLPTTYEAFCLAVVEALASGLPVITTDVPGAGDLVQHGRNGLLQRAPRDVDELTALLRLGADAPTRRAWASAAPGTVQHLTWAAIAERAADHLSTLPTR